MILLDFVCGVPVRGQLFQLSLKGNIMLRPPMAKNGVSKGRGRLGALQAKF